MCWTNAPQSWKSSTKKDAESNKLFQLNLHIMEIVTAAIWTLHLVLGVLSHPQWTTDLFSVITNFHFWKAYEMASSPNYCDLIYSIHPLYRWFILSCLECHPAELQMTVLLSTLLCRSCLLNMLAIRDVTHLFPTMSIVYQSLCWWINLETESLEVDLLDCKWV